MATTIITDLQEKFRRGNMVVRLIYINAGVYLLTALLTVLLTLFNSSLSGLLNWLELPASVGRFLMQPWSLFTYMFMHGGLLHILFNMLWLYWFGNLFMNYFSAKHLRDLYLIGGVCGGLLYMLAYNLFPYFAPFVSGSFVVGASASVLAIVAATAYRNPNYPIQLLLIGTIRLKYLALIVLGLDVLSITSGNAGGHIAHLGGALAGVWFAYRIGHPTLKVHKGSANYGSRQKDYDFNANKKRQNEEVDRILDKLKKSGYNSLTMEEKKSLFDASKR